MAQQIQTLFIDDIDGGPAEGTVRFGLDGTDYEIDLSPKNEDKMRKVLGRYVPHARKAGREPGRSHPSHTAEGRRRNAEVRAYAKAHGSKLGERGRIPAAVMAVYGASLTRQ